MYRSSATGPVTSLRRCSGARRRPASRRQPLLRHGQLRRRRAARTSACSRGRLTSAASCSSARGADTAPGARSEETCPMWRDPRALGAGHLEAVLQLPGDLRDRSGHLLRRRGRHAGRRSRRAARDGHLRGLRHRRRAGAHGSRIRLGDQFRYPTLRRSGRRPGRRLPLSLDDVTANTTGARRGAGLLERHRRRRPPTGLPIGTVSSVHYVGGNLTEVGAREAARQLQRLSFVTVLLWFPAP